MPRQARIDAPGALHHIMVRGIERKVIFRDATDRDSFVARLGKVLTDTETPCYAWALMSNHIHLLLMTGQEPIARGMSRLLTGYAQDFNRRHKRHGQLFQNRYKSILCERDAYLLELVRYIHLNPLRAGIVYDLHELKAYPYSGHAVLMGAVTHEWQDQDTVLKFFDKTVGNARRKYRLFVKEGVDHGRRPDLVGGGLLRSVGGWKELREYRRQGLRIKGDERILGSSDFVADVLEHAEEALEKSAHMKSQGFDFKSLLSKVATYYKTDEENLRSGSRQRGIARARAALCYLAVRRLKMSCKDVALELDISPSAVSNAVIRGKHLAEEAGLEKKTLK